LNQKQDHEFIVTREGVEYCARLYFDKPTTLLLVYRKYHYRDCDLLTLNVEMKLQGDQLISFLQENLLVFANK
jgi:hypothetical protein